MYKPAWYRWSYDMQRRDAKETIEKYWNKLQWRKDGGDYVLDVGCGNGDVTYEYIMPNLPESYARLVAIDYSDEMVEYARKQYKNPRLYYVKYDIGAEMDKQQYKHEPYDHIVSLYCLNWVQQQKQSIENMYKLLKPGGDMLVGFLAQNPIYEIYKEMAKDPKWAKYMSNVDYYVPPYQYSKDPAEEYCKLLSSYGFKNYSVEVYDKYYIYEGSDALKSKWTRFWNKISSN